MEMSSASALPLTKTVNLADRSFFQRALSTRDLSIGHYQVGRITGKPSFNLGYPVFDPFGQVQAVVFAALDLDWVNRSDYALQMQLPEGATWTKIDGNGTVLMRYPAPEKVAGWRTSARNVAFEYLPDSKERCYGGGGPEGHSRLL